MSSEQKLHTGAQESAICLLLGACLLLSLSMLANKGCLYNPFGARPSAACWLKSTLRLLVG